MNARCRSIRLGALATAVLLLGCSEARRYDQAICALVDVSGTYADQKAEVAKILKRDVLLGMVPGDTLIVIQIDSESYERENLVALMTLDQRPSRANAQKLALARKLDRFASSEAGSKYTDIPGAMMLGSEYLREQPSGSRVMLVFSDMREDLPQGSRRQLAETEFEGIHVVALNVKRLGSDNADPQSFRGRLVAWEDRVRAAGALGWRTFMDAAKLPAYLETLRSSGEGAPTV
ncbi:MAG: VWA domain-containing protein [Proteobacteria bacterium]|nr:VWA domain-containing protein [Pseudomonadota bacterium]